MEPPLALLSHISLWSLWWHPPLLFHTNGQTPGTVRICDAHLRYACSQTDKVGIRFFHASIGCWRSVYSWSWLPSEACLNKTWPMMRPMTSPWSIVFFQPVRQTTSVLGPVMDTVTIL